VTQFDEALRYKSEGNVFCSRWGDCYFALTWLLRPHYDPGVDSPSNRNGANSADNLTTLICRLSGSYERLKLRRSV